MAHLPTITLSNLKHREQQQIALNFEYNKSFIPIIKYELRGSWSASLKVWYVHNTAENLKNILSTFKGLATIDTGSFSEKLKSSYTLYNKKPRNLNSTQKKVLNGFYMYLKGKRYSTSTIRTYVFFIADFIDYNAAKPIYDLTNIDVDRFAENVLAKKGYSISSHRQFVSALKLFIAFEPNIKIDQLELQRPKKDKKLPVVLSQEEVLDLIRCTQNLKHRTIIALIYSCGLRISELINLKLIDINIDRRQLLIINSKGRKDRYVNLAESFLPLLSNYFFTYKPKLYFVEGASGGTYSPESIRQFIKRNCALAGIKKRVTPHTLRHSYATHLLENGIDIRYIQSLLGHARPETTMIYTHVKRKDLMEIANPLDVALKTIRSTHKPNTNVLLSRNTIG